MSAHYLKKKKKNQKGLLFIICSIIFNEENDLSTHLILPCLYCFPILHLITVPEVWKACLNSNSSLCPPLHEWVRCAKHHQRFCRRRESPDCVISNSSLLLLKPWAVLVCWILCVIVDTECKCCIWDVLYMLKCSHAACVVCFLHLH